MLKLTAAPEQATTWNIIECLVVKLIPDAMQVFFDGNKFLSEVVISNRFYRITPQPITIQYPSS